MTKKESFEYYQECEPEDMFDVKETTLEVPERARLFNSILCDKCNEKTAEHLVRLENGQNLCLDCYEEYNRFNI